MCWRDPGCLILEIWKILYYLNCNFGLIKVMFYKHCSYCVLVAFTCIISLITIPYCGGLVAQSCPILCDPMDCIPLGSSVCGIFQARILEWVAISFSRGTSWPRARTGVSCIAGRFFTDWTTTEAYITILVVHYFSNITELKTDWGIYNIS